VIGGFEAEGMVLRIIVDAEVFKVVANRGRF